MARLAGMVLFVVALTVVAEGRTVTFNEDIAPLVWKHCAHCHRPGEVAPFPLLSYHDVSKRAEQIVDVCERRSMPPWKPINGHGQFANGRQLADAELALLKQWVESGLVEGDAAQQSSPPTFASGWQLGTPDQIITMTEAAQVAADGRDLYLNVLLPVEVPAGQYIKAIEFRPGNRRVVHHAVLFYDTSGKARERDEADPRYGFEAVSPPGRFLPGALAIWTPGRNAMPLPEGLSMPWPAKADLVLNLHLHPSGKPESEQSSIGIHFTSEPPRRTMVDVTLIDTRIDIAPGEARYETSDSCVLPIDLEVLTIFPHMHMIGKQMNVTATLPDGTVRSLLRIDDWDFNWQDLYEYAPPIRLPKGTKIEMTGVHDNSADNPRNPSAPPERVRWGEQTRNEMSIAFLNLTPVDERDLVKANTEKIKKKFRAAIVPDATKAALAAAPVGPGETDEEKVTRQAREFLKHLDMDRNGKLSRQELDIVAGKAASAEELDRRMKQFDRDQDGELDDAELMDAIKALRKK
ncbi:MAG: EF-hand domain-containing protein [Planctomycetes bacterium]|nr:EF-hand domain-containing protein [Planctomycetota bacterium]